VTWTKAGTRTVTKIGMKMKSSSGNKVKDPPGVVPFPAIMISGPSTGVDHGPVCSDRLPCSIDETDTDTSSRVKARR
jgi:hypothetical protein